MTLGILEDLNCLPGSPQLNKSEGTVHVRIQVARGKLGNSLVLLCGAVKVFLHEIYARQVSMGLCIGKIF